MPHKGEKNFQMQFSCTYRLNVEETKFSFIFLLKYLQLVFLSHLHTWCWWISVQMPSSHALEVRHQPLVCAAEHTQSQFSTLADSAFDLLFTSVQLGLYLKPTNFVRLSILSNSEQISVMLYEKINPAHYRISLLLLLPWPFALLCAWQLKFLCIQIVIMYF